MMRLDHKGIMPVLIAIGIVSILAAMSMTMSMTSLMLQKKKVRQLNRMEGFYSNELAVWHQYFRNKENLVGENPNPDGSFNLAVDNEYANNILDLVPDSYSAESGIALNVMTTAPLAPPTRLFRRFTAGSVAYGTHGVSKANCSATSFGGSKKSRDRLCLAQTTDPKTTPLLLVGAPGKFCVLLNPGRGVQCWGENADGLAPAGVGNNSARPIWVNGLEAGVDLLWASADGQIYAKKGTHMISWGPNKVDEIWPGADSILSASGSMFGNGLHVHLTNGTAAVRFAAMQENSCQEITNWNWTLKNVADLPCFRSIPNVEFAVHVSSYRDFGCAALRNGDIKCWGGILMVTLCPLFA